MILILNLLLGVQYKSKHKLYNEHVHCVQLCTVHRYAFHMYMYTVNVYTVHVYTMHVYTVHTMDIVDTRP